MVAHLSEVSGAGVALLDTVRGLDPARFACTLVLPGEGPLAARARAAGVEPVIVPNPEVAMTESGLFRRIALLGARAAYVARLARFLRRSGFRLAYVSSTYSVFAGLAARLAGIRVVWHVHETIEKPGRALRAKLWMIERMASGLLYASRTGMESFPARRVRRRMVVRNAVDVERLRSARRDDILRAAWGAGPGDVVVLANGLFPRKGADVLLDAAESAVARGCAIRLVLAGLVPQGAEPFAEGLRRRASEGALKGRVHFAGLLPDMPAALASADLFVSASRNEALPIAIVEALVAGTRVISTNVGDCALLLEEGARGVLVPPGDAAALADALEAAATGGPVKEAALRRIGDAVAAEYGGPGFWKPLETFLAETVEGTPG